MPRYHYRRQAYKTPPELSGGVRGKQKIAIVGAGPIGLTLAIDLASRGVASLLLDENDVVSAGSRAICWAKRSLEIFDRLGVGERMVEKGVTWKVARIYHRDRELYSFDLLPEAGHKMPAFVNLQQYYVEEYLIERARDFPQLLDLRFRNKVIGIRQEEAGVTLEVETPDGVYDLMVDYVVVCDGARSSIRSMLGLSFQGQLFDERFLIADIEMQADFPAERRFWFEPTFHDGQSALLHKQPDDVYRIDLQLGREADAEKEKQIERVIPRIRAIVGDRPFDIHTVSVYSFQCSRLERFVQGRVIFAGDAAHVVSPFGARGGNGGIQDAEALAWRLAALVKGKAGDDILSHYDAERTFAADEDIKNSLRTTAFMTPKSELERMMRSAVFDLSVELPFARRLINSGRLSTPCSLARFYKSAGEPKRAPLAAGEVALDAPLERNGKRVWLLNQLGKDFALVTLGDVPPPVPAGVRGLQIGEGSELQDREGFAEARYGRGLSYLFRPDQRICAVFSEPDPRQIEAAIERELGRRTA